MKRIYYWFIIVAILLLMIVFCTLLFVRHEIINAAIKLEAMVWDENNIVVHKVLYSGTDRLRGVTSMNLIVLTSDGNISDREYPHLVFVSVDLKWPFKAIVCGTDSNRMKLGEWKKYLFRY